MGCLYQLTSPSGKGYIGISSKTAADRWRVHQMRVREGRDYALQQAIRKYGAEAFTVRTLVVADDWQYLCDLERRAIARFGTKTPDGYNLTDGGEGAAGRIATEDARINYSRGQKKRFTDPVERAALVERGRMAAAAMRKPQKPRRARGSATKELWRDPAYRERMSLAIRAAANTPEAKANHSAAARARAVKPEWRAKISAAKRGKKLKPQTDEHKAKIAAARRREWADPVIRERRLAALAKARMMR